jgi:hypothetical protein
VTGDWIDVRYCEICVWDFVKQPKRVTAEQIWRRQEEARKEQERLSVPESERRRIREEREERERQSRREYEEEMEEREREQEEEARRKKNAALWNILAKQEVDRLQKKEQEKERECMEEEDYDWGITYEQEELDPYDSLQSEDRSYDWIQAYANKFRSPPPSTVSRDGELSRSYDWDPKPDWTPCERRACCEILDDEDLIHEDSSKKEIPLDVINAIQQLKPKNLEVLSDYAELCEIDLFQAYHYKSRCHLYSCNKPLNPDYWDAEENVQFCCRRHGEYFEDCGHIEEDIGCDVCYSRPHQNYLPHTKNLVSYRALKKSNQGVWPIVSAIRVFDEVCMSNMLFDSLVDLCEFYI